MDEGYPNFLFAASKYGVLTRERRGARRGRNQKGGMVRRGRKGEMALRGKSEREDGEEGETSERRGRKWENEKRGDDTKGRKWEMALGEDKKEFGAKGEDKPG